MPTLTDLRKSYPPPRERAVLKTQHSFDAHMRRFISLSPFLCLGTSSNQGADVTPRGDAPGFVQVADDSVRRATVLAPYGQMLKDQTGVRESAEEIQASVEDGYRNNLY